MSLVLMNGHGVYITHNETGAIRKTQDLTQATDFKTLENAVAQCNYAPASTKGYYVFDTDARKVCYINGIKKRRRVGKHTHKIQDSYYMKELRKGVSCAEGKSY